jgi:hypothetical protein
MPRLCPSEAFRRYIATAKVLEFLLDETVVIPNAATYIKRREF